MSHIFMFWVEKRCIDVYINLIITRNNFVPTGYVARTSMCVSDSIVMGFVPMLAAPIKIQPVSFLSSTPSLLHQIIQSIDIEWYFVPIRKLCSAGELWLKRMIGTVRTGNQALWFGLAMPCPTLFRACSCLSASSPSFRRSTLLFPT